MAIRSLPLFPTYLRKSELTQKLSLEIVIVKIHFFLPNQFNLLVLILPEPRYFYLLHQAVLLFPLPYIYALGKVPFNSRGLHQTPYNGDGVSWILESMTWE